MYLSFYGKNLTDFLVNPTLSFQSPLCCGLVITPPSWVGRWWRLALSQGLQKPKRRPQPGPAPVCPGEDPSQPAAEAEDSRNAAERDGGTLGRIQDPLLPATLPHLGGHGPATAGSCSGLTAHPAEPTQDTGQAPKGKKGPKGPGWGTATGLHRARRTCQISQGQARSTPGATSLSNSRKESATRASSLSPSLSLIPSPTWSLSQPHPTPRPRWGLSASGLVRHLPLLH